MSIKTNNKTFIKKNSSNDSKKSETADKNNELRVKNIPDNFTWDYTDEPHATRRQKILAKYPEIKKLYGHEPNNKYVALFLVSLQLITAYLIKDKSWFSFIITAYFIGGTSNHMLMLAMHEASHNLFFRKPLYNKLIGIFSNLPIGVPSAISFKRYHMEHHRYQGQDGIDVDIPTTLEGNYIQSTLSKFLFVCFQVAFYALRPLIVNPKKPSGWEIINNIIQFSFDFIIYYIWGLNALTYLLLSTLLGSGLHPVAGHFISEHYVFIKGIETYSYYGILNIFAFNVGYHNEHHDFPFIPGSRLPQVRKIASEFYDTLPQHESWCRVIFDYITDPNINAFSRIKRNQLSKEELKKLKKQ